MSPVFLIQFMEKNTEQHGRLRITQVWMRKIKIANCIGSSGSGIWSLHGRANWEAPGHGTWRGRVLSTILSRRTVHAHVVRTVRARAELVRISSFLLQLLTTFTESAREIYL